MGKKYYCDNCGNDIPKSETRWEIILRAVTGGRKTEIKVEDLCNKCIAKESPEKFHKADN